MNATNSQPSAGQFAHNADLRVVLTNQAGDEQWRGPFSSWILQNDGAFTVEHVFDIADGLRHLGSVHINMGAGGTFVLTVENPVKCRQCTAINSADRDYCLLCRSSLAEAKHRLHAAPALLAALQKIYANAAESPEWIRRVAGEAIEKAGGAL